MPWLLAIVRHAAIDRRRSARRRDRQLAKVGADPATEVPVLTPEDAVAFESNAAHLLACLETLPEGRADAIRKAYFSGDSYADMALDSGHPEGTLKSWVHRSLRVLRACLEQRGVEGTS